jgi:hypothetical protein
VESINDKSENGRCKVEREKEIGEREGGWEQGKEREEEREKERERERENQSDGRFACFSILLTINHDHTILSYPCEEHQKPTVTQCPALSRHSVNIFLRNGWMGEWGVGNRMHACLFIICLSLQNKFSLLILMSSLSILPLLQKRLRGEKIKRIFQPKNYVRYLLKSVQYLLSVPAVYNFGFHCFHQVEKPHLLFHLCITSH